MKYFNLLFVLGLGFSSFSVAQSVNTDPEATPGLEVVQGKQFTISELNGNRKIVVTEKEYHGSVFNDDSYTNARPRNFPIKTCKRIQLDLIETNPQTGLITKKEVGHFCTNDYANTAYNNYIKKTSLIGVKVRKPAYDRKFRFYVTKYAFGGEQGTSLALVLAPVVVTIDILTMPVQLVWILSEKGVKHRRNLKTAVSPIADEKDNTLTSIDFDRLLSALSNERYTNQTLASNDTFKQFASTTHKAYAFNETLVKPLNQLETTALKLVIAGRQANFVKKLTDPNYVMQFAESNYYRPEILWNPESGTTSSIPGQQLKVADLSKFTCKISSRTGNMSDSKFSSVRAVVTDQQMNIIFLGDQGSTFNYECWNIQNLNNNVTIR